MTNREQGAAHRRPDHNVEDLLFSRWSPRAMSGEALTHPELMSLFEAANLPSKL